MNLNLFLYLRGIPSHNYSFFRCFRGHTLSFCKTKINTKLRSINVQIKKMHSSFVWISININQSTFCKTKINTKLRSINVQIKKMHSSFVWISINISMATHDQMTLILWNLTLFIYIHFPSLHYSKQPVKPISQAMSQLIGLSVIQKWNFTSKFVR